MPVKVQPIRAWQGLIQPYASDEEARLILRLLACDKAVDVAEGRITPPPEVRSIMPHAAEPRLTGCDIAFDVLVLEFEPPAHPWIFSLSPAISRSQFHNHPHLRTDRILRLPSRTLHGLCMYSAAEFEIDQALPIVPQVLNQAAIFLAKHIVWLKTQGCSTSQQVKCFTTASAILIDHFHRTQSGKSSQSSSGRGSGREPRRRVA